jgi:hypothetical protein|tara:strand:+ start:1227 stop:1433 length:207 start_codon:yes stop_codon:yes gene_type:complete
MINDVKELSLSEFLQKRIRENMHEHADFISTGSCKDFEEYKKITGIIEGLALAERELLDWIERHIKEE